MYSERLRELFHSRTHAGRLDDATHYGEAGTPGQGPFIQLWLRAEDGRVEAALFKTYGCPAVIACGEALCRAVEGTVLGETAVTSELITAWTDGVPDDKTHCPKLAAEAWHALQPLGAPSLGPCGRQIPKPETEQP